MSAQLEIQLIAVVVAVACTLPGVFLVLRKMAMMTDAITHTILLGIVGGYFIVHNLSSPLLIIGAALSDFGSITTNRLTKAFYDAFLHTSNSQVFHGFANEKQL